MSKVVRTVKNVTKGYTTAQVKVRNGTYASLSQPVPSVSLTVAATSNDAWGPVGSDMAEIAQLTYEYV